MTRICPICDGEGCRTCERTGVVSMQSKETQDSEFELFETSKGSVVIRKDLINVVEFKPTTQQKIQFQLKDGSVISVRGTEDDFKDICKQLIGDSS